MYTGQHIFVYDTQKCMKNIYAFETQIGKEIFISEYIKIIAGTKILRQSRRIPLNGIMKKLCHLLMIIIIHRNYGTTKLVIIRTLQLKMIS